MSNLSKLSEFCFFFFFVNGLEKLIEFKEKTIIWSAIIKHTNVQ